MLLSLNKAVAAAAAAHLLLLLLLHAFSACMQSLKHL
jgi:hypothetical protein